MNYLYGFDVFPKPRGRPTRWKFEKSRTILWSRGVKFISQTPFKKLETVLGPDGRWNGLWSRYQRGSVSPTPERIRRIDAILPGTARYYFCPLWKLLENRTYTREELDECVWSLDPVFQKLFIAFEEPVFGKRWRNHSEESPLFTEINRLISDVRLGIDALSSLMILVREAEYLQNSEVYLRALKAFSACEEKFYDHPFLRCLNVQILDYLAEPLRHIHFSPKSLDADWKSHISSYCRIRNTNIDEMEVMDCLSHFR